MLATDARVAAYRRMIERAVAGSGVEADILEAIVFLESAGTQRRSRGATRRPPRGLRRSSPRPGRCWSGCTSTWGPRALTARIDAAYALGDVVRAARLALETAAPSSALVLHAPRSTTSFRDPAALREAYARRIVLPLPPTPGA